MVWVIVVVVAIVVVLLLVIVAMYNRLVRLRNRAENRWAHVDVQLRRRYHLIPNLGGRRGPRGHGGALPALRRRCRSHLALAPAARVAPPGAFAQSCSPPAPSIDGRVARDASLLARGLIPFAFSGPFTGAYRDIPLR